MQFKASEKKVKATLEIEEVVYKFYSPTVGQADKFAKMYEENKSNNLKLYELMRNYISELGSVPVEKIMDLDNDLFTNLFNYITEPVKKN